MNVEQSLRSTQRAPKSCTSCTSRKIRCDKAIPCGPCIKRGTASACQRETVLVRGKVTTAASSHASTYEELLQENRRLKSALDGTRPPLYINAAVKNNSIKFLSSDDPADEYERLLFSSVVYEPRPRVQSVNDIIFPSHQCSNSILRYARLWTSWVHFALHHPTFEKEHDAFWDSLYDGHALDRFDSLWMAIYFSVISTALLIMDEDHAAAMQLPSQDLALVSRNWYEAALYYLDISDYMRKFDIRIVQAIAILGISFNNFGDYYLYQTMWACAIRVAQALGMNRADTSHLAFHSEEHSRRLWWTLMICEWMPVPFHNPCISKEDFDVPLPLPLDEDGLISPEDADALEIACPAHYHIALAKIATVYYDFRKMLRIAADDTIVDIVSTADKQLADVISGLPEHFQPEAPKAERRKVPDVKQPWVSWQKWDLTLTLLYYRLAINRTLQRKWHILPNKLSGQRAICLESARSTLWLSQNWDYPASQRKQWASSIQIFTAGVTLALELHERGDLSDSGWSSDVKYCIELLDKTKSQSVIAERGVEILKGLLPPD